MTTNTYSQAQDPNIISLVNALGALPGIVTMDSFDRNDEDKWQINFAVAPGQEACFALQFIAQTVRDWREYGQLPRFAVFIVLETTFRFGLEGWDEQEAGELAAWINEARELRWQSTG